MLNIFFSFLITAKLYLPRKQRFKIWLWCVYILFQQPPLKTCYLSQQNLHWILWVLCFLRTLPMKKLLSPDFWKKSVQYRKYRQYSIEKTTNFTFVTEEVNNSKEKRKRQCENKVKEQINRKCKQPQFFLFTRSENEENSSIQTDIHNQGWGEILKRNAASAGKTTCNQLRRITGPNVWAAETGCTNSLLLSKTNASTAIENYRERKKQQDAEEGLENFVNWILDSWINFVLILCFYGIFSI